VLSRALGDPAVSTGPNQFVLTGGSIPEAIRRRPRASIEVAAVFKFQADFELDTEV